MVVVDFQRARTDEQRGVRRQRIISTLREMLEDRRVGDVSLNELARRVGLAKSNVLRYYSSREVAMLAVLVDDYTAYVAETVEALGSVSTVPAAAEVLAAGLAGRPILCELISAAPSVLEYNADADVLADYRRAVAEADDRLLDALAERLGYLNGIERRLFLNGFKFAVAGIWQQANPSKQLTEARRANADIEPAARFEPDLRAQAELLLGAVEAPAGQAAGGRRMGFQR